MNKDIYKKQPIEYRGKIPVFSRQTKYTENYEKISFDHLKSIEKDGSNPFIRENLWRQSEQSTIDLIKKYCKSDDMILDVGVGLGRILKCFPPLKRYGMDISFGYLEFAQKEGIEVCYAMVEDMPYNEEIFDIVICTDILEHTFDLNFCIAKILSVLKKGGLLIVRVPYREELSGYLNPDYPYEYAHIRNFDENSLRLLFEKVFRCEMIETSNAGFMIADDRITRKELFDAEEFDSLKNWLFKIEMISPSLYWDILRKLSISVEINAVILKNITHELDIIRELIFSDNQKLPSLKKEIIIKGELNRNKNIDSLEKELMAQCQKNSYLEAKIIEMRNERNIASEIDSLHAELDAALIEKNELYIKLNNITKKLKKWHLSRFFQI